MRDGDAAKVTAVPADQSAALHRLGLQIEGVSASIARISTAVSVMEALPDAMGSLAQLLNLERVVVLETLSRGAQCSQRPLFHWSAPDSERTAPHVDALMLPIMVEDKPWGCVCFDDARSEHHWTAEEIKLLSMLVQVIGAAITRERYREELARADTIIQGSPTILYRLRGEPSLPMVYVSKNIARLGHEPAQLLSAPTHYRELIHPEDRGVVQEALQRLLQPGAPAASVECRMLTGDGGVRWFENCYTPVRDAAGHLLEIEGILIDISEHRMAEAKIAQLARSDVLTGLANRMTFSDRLRQALAAAQRGARAFAVLYLDLDRFKEVNDTLGHHAGDRLLQEVSRRLRDVTREVDVVARLGGDEFAIVQTGIEDSTAAGALAEKLIEIVSAPYVIDGNDLRIGVSIGISLYELGLNSPDELLMQADQALYRAKHAGRGQYRFHSDEIDLEVREHLLLAEDLRTALARYELELRYQPQVELSSGRIVGMEALLRWNHPTRGLLLPEDFLPVAEKYGIMQQLGRWAMDTACRQMALWRGAGMQVPVVAINIALAQIKMGREFVRDVIDSIARWGLKPSDIELDVTEFVLARSTLAQSNVLDQLRRVGVGIAIDDFGSQYSSLDYLRNYRVNRLKIARGMIAAAEAEPGGVAMVRAILSLAGELGIVVVAEGVETDTQRKLLVQASAHAQGQGFFYSRAVPADETIPMLRAGVVRPEDHEIDKSLREPEHDPPAHEELVAAKRAASN
jgi:diguanylate cyclase (GGDEF)-like protein/PAS domain S-box-containing protein